MRSPDEPLARTLWKRAATPGGVLVAFGAWAVAVPYIGPVLGLRLDVASKLEFVDHVIPGTVVAVSGVLLLAIRAKGGDASSGLWLAAAGATFLAGVWMISTHVPLVGDANAGDADWGPTILHNSPGLTIGLLSVWLLFEALRSPEARRS